MESKKIVSNPLISIVIPAYNVERYIERCLDSILKQTYRNLEILVIDDCSTDTTSNIIDSYANRDHRIRAIHHKNNLGYSGARNTGLDNCHGKYVTFVDADDWVEIDYVKYLYTILSETAADVSLSRNFFTSRFKKQIAQDHVNIISSEDMLCDIFYNRIHVGVWNRLYSISVIGNHRFRLASKTGEGMEFNTEVIPSACRIACGLRRVYTYNVDNNMSATKKPNVDKQALGAIENIEFICNRMTGLSNRLNDALKYQYFTTSLYSIEHLIRANALRSHKKFYRHLCSVCRTIAFSTFFMDVSIRQKIKSFAVIISPFITAYSAVIWRYKFGKKQRV